ncbi:hypothetical protein I79_013872 [Cricetulus griseus]|uniref:Uncharacterized protein n=1 Tax=Cricetulus griseus TaxID=10029 RepID=G3HSN8_CRIGR|nr:hypothetical protein I79_013872 [Cricetulus griseus]
MNNVSPSTNVYEEHQAVVPVGATFSQGVFEHTYKMKRIGRVLCCMEEGMRLFNSTLKG